MKKLIKHAFPVVSVALCLLSILVVCGKKPDAKKEPAEKITIACARHPGSLLIQIAAKEGFFAAEGIAATLQPQASGKIALNAVLRGQADLATVAQTPIVFAILSGEQLYALAVIQTSNKNEAIVARKDRHISQPADLKGKTIGVTLGTNSEYFFEAYLLAQGIDRKTVRILDLVPDAMPAAIMAGKVDAVACWNPNLCLIRQALDQGGRIFYGETFYTEIFCVAAGRDFVKKHPETVKKVLRALIKAEEFVKRHPDEARRLMAAFLQAEQALIAEIWPDFSYTVLLDQALLVSLEEEARWALKSKLKNATMPNYLDSIYFDGLQAVKPEAVTVIR